MSMKSWIREFLARCAKSKTMWLNTIVALLATAEASFHMLQPSLRAEVYGYALFGLTLLNVALRIITTRPILPNKDAPR